MDERMKEMFDGLFFTIFKEYGLLISDACIVFRKTDNFQESSPMVNVVIVG